MIVKQSFDLLNICTTQNDNFHDWWEQLHKQQCHCKLLHKKLLIYQVIVICQ
jgi:hypothetical protein